MEKKVLLLACLSVLTFSSSSMAVCFNDGQSHNIDDTFYQYEGIYLDQSIDIIPGTHLNLNTGGVVGSITLRNHSSATISGGVVNHGLSIGNNSTATITGGIVTEDFKVSSDGILYLVGTNFFITTDGETTALAYNSHLSDYCTLITPMGAPRYYSGIVTGTLADGSSLNNQFYIFDGYGGLETRDIVVIPEPATLSLLGLGGLLIRRKRK